jgi:hypothetical protein
MFESFRLLVFLASVLGRENIKKYITVTTSEHFSKNVTAIAIQAVLNMHLIRFTQVRLDKLAFPL